MIQKISQAELDRQQAYARAFSSLPDRPRTYHIVTYGCQMNAHDSEKLAGMLEDMGLTRAPTREEADFVLHNTCCLRDNAERKALGNVTWLKEIKKERPSLLIGVCGCMVQEKGMAERILNQYPFIDLAFGTGNLHELPGLLFRAAQERSRVVAVPQEQSTIAEGLPIRRESPYQAYVTIMYGCNNFCTYCIVPYVRGRERSRTPEDILRDVEGLVKAGTQEIMLLGQNVNSYGKELPGGWTFARLLSEVAKTGIPRIRFMTSHPKDLTDELIRVIADTPAVQRHFHLPAQSGSDRVLKAMNRYYNRAQYLDRARALREAVPDIGLTTDLIVAFPGETEAEFEDTLSLVETVDYDSAFTFIYSPRVGTPAAALPDQIPPDVAAERIDRLIKAQEKHTEARLNSLIGTRQEVLVTDRSRRDETMMTGKCGRNININFEGAPGDLGRILPVQVTSAGKTTLRGIRLED